MDAKNWVESPEGKCTLEKALFSTSRFVSLTQVRAFLVGSLLYLRLSASTGDSKGTNILSLAAEKLFAVMMSSEFEDMTIITLSENFCAIDWVEGRGKSVAAQARIPRTLVKSVLKTTAQALVEFNTAKNFIESAVAGTIGGFNAHASNVVSAIFLATGQDIARNVESSNCVTTMSVAEEDLVISVTMPSIKVGTVGGGPISQHKDHSWTYSMPANQVQIDLVKILKSSRES